MSREKQRKKNHTVWSLWNGLYGPAGTHYDLGCVFCRATIRGHWKIVGHGGIGVREPRVKTKEEATMRKPGAGEKRGPEGQWEPDTNCTLHGYPLICEMLSTSQWEDGTAREPSQLAITVYEGGIRIALNDRELKQSIYTQGDTLLECLDLMEGGLRSEAVRWYAWNRGKKVK